jgi:hypothetical protein
MAVILREFRKNIEYTKYIEKKREEMRIQSKTGAGPRNVATGTATRKPIVNDLFTAEKNNQRAKKLSSSPTT